MEAPASKRARVTAGGDDDGDEADADRLSDMPDEILHAIFSFLPTHQAVQTSALSKRWRDLWTTMPFIDIDQHQLAAAAGGGNKTAAQWDKLESFAYPLLLAHRAGTLERFRVSVNVARRMDALQLVVRWVHRGVRCFPAAVEVEVVAQHCFARRLELDLPAASTGDCYYRRLRRLHLSGVSLGVRFAEQVRSRLPVLEDLQLRGCATSFAEIASRTLTRLVVHGSGNGNNSACADGLAVTAPRLSSLCLLLPHGHFSNLVVNEATCLANASVSLRPWPTRSQRRIVGCLFNVTSLLLLRLDAKAMLLEEAYELPMFHYLKNLSLEYCFIDQGCSMKDKFRALGKFLRYTPQLEKLTLQHCMISERLKRGEEDGETNLDSVPDLHDFNTSQCPNLKVIEIKYKYKKERETSKLLWDIWTNNEKMVVFTKTRSSRSIAWDYFQ